MNQPVMVSVICMAYNHERYIRQALNGFLMQKTDFPFEVLISDDASTDNTAAIIREYEEKYPEIIKPVYYSENQFRQHKSPMDALRKAAKGKYIALCEGDDFWIDPNKLQIQIDYLESHPDCSACVHGAFQSYENGVFLTYGYQPYDHDTDIPAETFIEACVIHTTSIVFKRTILGNNAVPFQKDSPCGDYPLMIFLALNGTVHYLSRTMSVYRTGSAFSVMKKFLRSSESTVLYCKKIFALIDRIDDYTHGQYAANTLVARTYIEEKRLKALGSIVAVAKSKLFRHFTPVQKKSVLYCCIPSWVTGIYEKVLRKQPSVSAEEEYQKCLERTKALTYDNIVILEPLS